MIIVITGPSGVGKTTLLHGLIRALPHARALMSYTTRHSRPTDEPGEYAYIDEQEFEGRLQAGEFLWEAHTYKSRYGTRKEDIDFALTHDTYIPILVMDAAKKLHSYSAEGVTFLYLHIDDEQELHRRFNKRGDAPEEAETRIAECKSWYDESKKSGVPFIYLDGKKAPEELLGDVLKALA